MIIIMLGNECDARKKNWVKMKPEKKRTAVSIIIAIILVCFGFGFDFLL